MGKNQKQNSNVSASGGSKSKKGSTIKQLTDLSFELNIVRVRNPTMDTQSRISGISPRISGASLHRNDKEIALLPH
jgi:hypothetical protein